MGLPKQPVGREVSAETETTREILDNRLSR
jgi:hypothetical protein